MNDDTPEPHDEFTVRVRKRLRDPGDDQPCECTGTCPGGGNPVPTACMEGGIRRMPANEVLAEENRHFGYRVANEMARFVMLAANQVGEDEEQLDIAFDHGNF